MHTSLQFQDNFTILDSANASPIVRTMWEYSAYTCIVFGCSWLSQVWNETVSPIVRDAVLQGTGKANQETSVPGKDSTDGSQNNSTDGPHIVNDSTDGQQKVANTALYVLMQRSLVPGCPLSGQGVYRKLYIL
jgi:hypothetical protein